MGGCHQMVENNEEGHSKLWIALANVFNTIGINRTHFKFHCVVGKGGFGKVWKVERKKFETMYAMKEMSKVRIVNKKSVNSVINERKLLAQLKHP